MHLPSSPKFRVQVAEPLIPILCSTFPVLTSLNSPREPSSFTLYLGTMNMEMPLVPAGSPSILARTGWTILGVRSWSPLEMNILVPVML